MMNKIAWISSIIKGNNIIRLAFITFGIFIGFRLFFSVRPSNTSHDHHNMTTVDDGLQIQINIIKSDLTYFIVTYAHQYDNNVEYIRKHSGFFEEHLKGLYLRSKSHGLVVDVGSNIGDLAIYAAMKGDTVHAIELVDNIRFCLYLSKILNNLSNLIITNYLLGSTKSMVHYNVEGQELGIQMGTSTTSKTGIKSIRVTTIDAQYPDVDIKFLKIDIEGKEIEVLRGAKQSLKDKRIKELFIELWEWELELLDLLEGYQCGFVNIQFEVLYPNVTYDSLREFKIRAKDVFGGKTNLLTNIHCMID